MKRLPRYLYMDGQIVPYPEAKVHVLSTAFKYAAAVFEGIRAYWSDPHGTLYLFRLKEHLDRLADSARVSRISLPLSADEMVKALVDLIRANELKEDLHIRILVYVAEEDGTLFSANPVGLTIAAMPMGRYPGDAEERGLDVCISHWQRLSDAAAPPRIKATSNYGNSRLALLQARADGYDDAILTDGSGKVTEGPGYNLFAVRKGQVLTPPVTSSILEGVTRDTLIQLFASEYGIQVAERPIDKTELYVADELFFCGSGKEVMPIRSVDRHTVGNGATGRLTAAIRETYFQVVRGGLDRYAEWLLAVPR